MSTVWEIFSKKKSKTCQLKLQSSWTDQKFSDSRTGVLKCLVKFLRPVEILQVQDRSNSGRWKISKCFPVTTKFRARLPEIGVSQTFCFLLSKFWKKRLEASISEKLNSICPLSHCITFITRSGGQTNQTVENARCRVGHCMTSHVGQKDIHFSWCRLQPTKKILESPGRFQKFAEAGR